MAAVISSQPAGASVRACGPRPPCSLLSARILLTRLVAQHAAAYSFGGKDGAGADLSERTLYDVYLRPWRDYARAGLAHNMINDVPCHASKTLMDQLRVWGHGMFMASDFCDVGLLRRHDARG